MLITGILSLSDVVVGVIHLLAVSFIAGKNPVLVYVQVFWM